MPSPLHRWLRVSVGVLMLFLGAIEVHAQATSSREYQVKAVFLFNFARFVEWPRTTFPEPHTPLVIGVLGEDPFGAYLDDTVRGETVSGRPLVVQRYRRVDEVQTCHILFVAASEREHADAVLAALRSRPILTVSDSPGFAGRGGMIELYMEKSKVRLRIDLAPAKTAGLAISSKLLRPADVIPVPPL